jgi:hypothetical protein
MTQNTKPAGPKRIPTGPGCLLIALLLGFGLGYIIGVRALPGYLPWFFAFMFAVFFGALAFIFTGMTTRRDRGLVTETFVAIPAALVFSLKAAIAEANPPSQLTTSQVGKLDAILAELEELGRLLKRQPRAGQDPGLPARLEQIAAEWLTPDQLERWMVNNNF